MKVIILCARKDGHPKIVLDILKQYPEIEVIGFLDDDPSLVGDHIGDIQILGSIGSLKDRVNDNLHTIIATGNIFAREKIANFCDELKIPLINAIHPNSTIAKDVLLGKGIVITAGAIVNPGSTIGDNVIINTGATIDHDNKIESFVNISPGVHLSGRVHIKKYSFIGIGAVVIPDVTIGKNVTIGAGAAVVNDIPDNVVAVGVPARIIKRKDPI